MRPELSLNKNLRYHWSMQERRGARPSYNYQGVRRGQYDSSVVRPPAPSAAAAEAPRQLTPVKKSRRKLILLGVAVLVAIIVGAGAELLFIKKDPGPVPKNVSQSVNFPLYYPSALPSGYQLEKNTFSVQNDMVFYHLINGDSTIVISEQASPPNPLDLKSAPGFGEVPSAAGQAAAGMVSGTPVAIVVTEKTMINIQGSKNTSRDLVAKLAQSMSASR